MSKEIIELLEKINTVNLYALADWLDIKYKDNPTPQVQVDLRQWSKDIDQALTLLKQQPTGEPKCKTCGDTKRVEVCDNCYPNNKQIMQQIDSYPKLNHCIICAHGHPKEIPCPDCQQQTIAGKQLIICRPRQMGKMTEWVKQLRPEVKIEESDCQQQRAGLLVACEAVQIRIAFIGMPSEPMNENGPDWSKEIALIEAAKAKAKKEG